MALKKEERITWIGSSIMVILGCLLLTVALGSVLFEVYKDINCYENDVRVLEKLETIVDSCIIDEGNMFDIKSLTSNDAGEYTIYVEDEKLNVEYTLKDNPNIKAVIISAIDYEIISIEYSEIASKEARIENFHYTRKVYVTMMVTAWIAGVLAIIYLYKDVQKLYQRIYRKTREGVSQLTPEEYEEYVRISQENDRLYGN